MEKILTRSAILTRCVSEGEAEAAIPASPAIPSLTLRARIARRARIYRKRTSAARLRPPKQARRGVATLDYMLVIAVVLPLAAFLMWAGPRMMNLVYEMTAVLVSWPFL